MKLFSLNASRVFGERVASALGLRLSVHEERLFEDGEHKCRPLESVRGEDVYVIQSLYGGPDLSPNDKICIFLFFLGALRDAGAARITAVVPYLAYARKDRKTKSRDPVTSRYMAQLFEAMSVDRVVTLDVHNVSAFQNSFRCPTEHLEMRTEFCRHIAAKVKGEKIVVASPDPGGVKRAQLFRETLERIIGRPVEGAFLEKRRSSGVVSGTHLAGDVAEATVFVVDDLISSGGTMERAAEACLREGARSVSAIATHGLFTAGADRMLTSPRITNTVISDTVPAFRLDQAVVETHVEIVSAAPLVASALRALHENGSITALSG